MFKKKPVKKLSSKAVEVKSKNKPEKSSKNISPKVKDIAKVVGILLVIGIVLWGMVTGVTMLGESIKPTKSYDTYSYNGFDFTGNGVLWQTTIYNAQKDTEYTLQLHNGPKDLEDVPVTGDVKSMLNRATGFYLTFDPAENESMGQVALASYEISSNYNTVYDKPILPACDKNFSPDCDGIAIIDCTNPNIPAIYVIAEGKPEVIVDGPCIYIKGEGDGVVKAANRLLYTWYGIMD